MITTIQEDVAELRRWQREYKAEQRRAAKTMPGYTATASVSLDAQALTAKTIWIACANGSTLLTTLMCDATGSTLGQIRWQPVYEDGKYGYRITNGLDGAITANFTVLANQEVTLSVS